MTLISKGLTVIKMTEVKCLFEYTKTLWSLLNNDPIFPYFYGKVRRGQNDTRQSSCKSCVDLSLSTTGKGVTVLLGRYSFRKCRNSLSTKYWFSKGGTHEVLCLYFEVIVKYRLIQFEINVFSNLYLSQWNKIIVKRFLRKIFP